MVAHAQLYTWSNARAMFRWEVCTGAADGLGRHEVGLANAVGAMYVQE